VDEFNPTMGNVDGVIRGMMALVKTGDKGGIMGGMANYLFYKDQYREENPTATDQEVIDYAIKKFVRDTKLTQQSADIVDKGWYQQQPGMWRFTTMFKSAIKGYSRKVEQSIRQMVRAAKGEPYKGDVKGLMYQAFLYHTFLPVIFQYVALWFPGFLTPWDDEDEQALLSAGVIGNINSVFLIGDFIKSANDYLAKKPWGENISFGPLQHLYERLFLPVADLWLAMDEKDPIKKEEKIRESIRILAFSIIELRGLAIETGYKWARNLYKVFTGDTKTPEETTMRIMNASDWWIEGEKKKKKKKKKKGSSKKGSNTGGYKPPTNTSKGGYKSPKNSGKSTVNKGTYKSPVVR